jgi:hypothetical protein
MRNFFFKKVFRISGNSPRLWMTRVIGEDAVTQAEVIKQ